MATCGSWSRRHLFPFLFILSGYCQFVWVNFLLYVPSGRQPLAHRLTSSLSSSSCTCHLVMAFMSGWKKKKINLSTDVKLLWSMGVEENCANGNYSKLVFWKHVSLPLPPTIRVVKSPSSNHYRQILFGTWQIAHYFQCKINFHSLSLVPSRVITRERSGARLLAIQRYLYTMY